MMEQEQTAAEMVRDAQAAAPAWQWNNVDGDPRLRHGICHVSGHIDVGSLRFNLNFHGLANRWELHWGPDIRSLEILKAYGARAQLFPKIVISMRDMIGDFLANAHPDDLLLLCASQSHAKLYVEHLPAGTGDAHTFKPAVRMRSGEEVTIAVEFWRDMERHRPHRFRPDAFVMGEPRIPVEFERSEPFLGI